MIVDGRIPSADALVGLYESVGWSEYVDQPDRLLAAVGGSLRVCTAWVGDRLIGLARVVGDGVSIVYLQDMLVHPELQRGGVGAELLRAVMGPYASVRQQVLLTDDQPGVRAFYEAMGFSEVSGLGLLAFARLANQAGPPASC